MRTVSDRNCKDTQNKHCFFNNFPLPKNRAVNEIMLRNIVEPGRSQMTIWRVRITCWIPKSKNTHSEYMILIPFLLQQWLHERPSMLRFTCIACLINYKDVITLTKRDRHSVCSVKTTEAINSPSHK